MGLIYLRAHPERVAPACVLHCNFEWGVHGQEEREDVPKDHLPHPAGIGHQSPETGAAGRGLEEDVERRSRHHTPAKTRGPAARGERTVHHLLQYRERVHADPEEEVSVAERLPVCHGTVCVQVSGRRMGQVRQGTFGASPLSQQRPDQAVLHHPGQDGVHVAGKPADDQGKGGNPYPEGITKDITVYRKGGKWWAAITYEIDDPLIEDTGVVAGIDRNASGMIAVAYSDGRDSEVLESEADKRVRFRKRRYERKLAKQIARQKAAGRKKMSNRAKKTQGKIQKCSTYLANFSHNRNHQNSAKISKEAPVVVVENLKVKSMTASARGTTENPGKNVKAKAGMNRVLLEGAPGQLVQMLGYKCLAVLCVVAAYTSEDCSRCGHRDAGNRASLRKFKCMSCGHAEHADINAAANILASGVEASGRARGEPLGSLMTRQQDWDQDK